MPARDLDLLKDAAQAAGEIAGRFFKADPEAWDKGDGQGPVTEADLAIDRMLNAELLGARPDYGWLSEETEDDKARLDSEHVFIIDPIDGTRAFIAGEKHFAHSLAIARNGVITAAVVYLPMLDKTYSATLKGGAFLNDQPIRPSEQSDMEQARVLANKNMFKADLWPGGVPDLKRSFRPSLAYRMCLAAEGRYDAMLTLRPTWEWDVAAGDLITTEAGGIVTTRTNAPAVYNNPKPQLDGMIAAGSALHGQLLARL